MIIYPLTLLSISLIIFEFRTGLIPDKITFPSGIYFLIAAAMVGQKLWWQYLLGLVVVCIICLLIAEIIYYLFNKNVVGGGAIKLLMVIGAALGLNLGVQVAGIFIFSAIIVSGISYVLFKKTSVPSSPIICVSMMIVLIFNFRDSLLLS